MSVCGGSPSVYIRRIAIVTFSIYSSLAAPAPAEKLVPLLDTRRTSTSNLQTSSSSRAYSRGSCRCRFIRRSAPSCSQCCSPSSTTTPITEVRLGRHTHCGMMHILSRCRFLINNHAENGGRQTDEHQTVQHFSRVICTSTLSICSHTSGS